MWDASVLTLSNSYQKTSELLTAGKQQEAAAEFRQQFAPTAKKLSTDAASTYPTRFNKINDWCSWSKNLQSLSAQAEKILSGDDSAASAKSLAALRQHFYTMHKETDTLAVNDYIYAFRAAVAKDAPTVDELRTLRDAADKAKPSVKAKDAATAEAFAKAKAQWLTAVDGALQGGKLDAAELQTLRTATERFYLAFGIQFE